MEMIDIKVMGSVRTLLEALMAALREDPGCNDKDTPHLRI